MSDECYIDDTVEHRELYGKEWVKEPGPGREGGERDGRTGFIYMPMHNRSSARALSDHAPTFVLPKRGHEHTMVPCKPPDKPQPMLVRTYAGEVMLEEEWK